MTHTPATDTSRHVPGRGRIYDSIVDTIGDTPIVRLDKIAKVNGVKANLLGKLEFFNPTSSVKDRIGVGMITAMEAAGTIAPGRNTLVEPTSGNTGIGLGADLVLTPAALGMKGAITKAHELLETIPGAVMPQQFENPANPAIHVKTTAEEIWNDTKGEIDAFIAGVGTGGTITGVGEALKPRRPSLKVIAVEPEDSPVLSGGKPGLHKIQGIGAGFVPPILDTAIIDEVIKIGNQTSFDTARQLARIEGIPGGISSGAAVAAAIEVGLRPGYEGKTIVVIIPSFAERYLSTALFDGL
jgi:cysteine synthase A